MSYTIKVHDISRKFDGGFNSWINLTWGAIGNDKKALEKAYQDADCDPNETPIWEFCGQYEPVMDYVHVLQYEPQTQDILKVAENAPEIIVLKDPCNNYYLGLSGAGMNLSEELAYAYMVLDRHVPACFEIDQNLCLSESAYKELTEFINKQKAKL